MQGVLTTRDGRNYTVLDERDVLFLVEDYAGSEIRAWLDEWMNEQTGIVEEAIAEVKEYQDDIDKLQDHQRLVLSDIYEDAAWLLKLTGDSRLKRSDIRECAQKICRVLYKEL